MATSTPLYINIYMFTLCTGIYNFIQSNGKTVQNTKAALCEYPACLVKRKIESLLVV